MDLQKLANQNPSNNVLATLLQAKRDSDLRRYKSKHNALRKLIKAKPEDYVIDSEERGIYGITHIPSGFKIHIPKAAAPAELQAPAVDDVYVHSAVPAGLRDLVKKHGLLSSQALLNNPEALKAFLGSRKGTDWEEDEEGFKKRVEEKLKDTLWGDSMKGPSVFFGAPDPEKITDVHPMRKLKSEMLRVNLSRLLRDHPKTRIAGSELQPYDPKGPEHQGDLRHYDIDLDRVREYAATAPKELWKHYDDPEGTRYASNVPHAQLITPSGGIPPEYLEFNEPREDEKQAGRTASRVRVVMPYGKGYLMEKLNNPKFPDNLGKVRFPGGGINEGETAEEAAVREMQEELGLTVDPAMLKRLGIHPGGTYGPEQYFSYDDHGLEPGDYEATVGGDKHIELLESGTDNPNFWGSKLDELQEEKETLYHGSPTGGIAQLEPRPHSLTSKPSIFAATDENLALSMALPATDQELAMGYEEDKATGKKEFVIDELQPGKLSLLDAPAHIYDLPSATFSQQGAHPELMQEERISHEPVSPLRVRQVQSILQELRNRDVTIRPYDEVPKEKWAAVVSEKIAGELARGLFMGTAAEPWTQEYESVGEWVNELPQGLVRRPNETRLIGSGRPFTEVATDFLTTGKRRRVERRRLDRSLRSLNMGIAKVNEQQRRQQNYWRQFHAAYPQKSHEDTPWGRQYLGINQQRAMALQQPLYDPQSARWDRQHGVLGDLISRNRNEFQLVSKPGDRMSTWLHKPTYQRFTVPSAPGPFNRLYSHVEQPNFEEWADAMRAERGQRRPRTA